MRNKLDKAELLKFLEETPRSIAGIAAEFKVTTVTVGRWIERLKAAKLVKPKGCGPKPGRGPAPCLWAPTAEGMRIIRKAAGGTCTGDCKTCKTC